MYRVNPTLQVGVEVNPLEDDFGPLANWVAVEESESYPALILGTSSDRIGTDTGQVYYATVSKNLSSWLGVPLSPYVGTGWSDRTNRWEDLAGLSYPLFDGRVSVTHIWDGVNLHHTANTTYRKLTLGLIVAEQDSDYFLGATIGLVF